MGLIMRNFLESSSKIKKINLEYNELFALGTDYIAQGIRSSNSLKGLNIRGNAIRDEGAECLAEAILRNNQIEELDISLNEITPLGQARKVFVQRNKKVKYIQCFCLDISDIVGLSGLQYLNISKNLLGDESIIYLADSLKKYEDSCRLNKIDFSSCRIGDGGILYFLEKTEGLMNLQFVKLMFYSLTQ
jgi:Ran GTPase-activating protein (RanGAP) involved in mRNA processing and transport